MKCVFTSNMKAIGSSKIKRHALVLTGNETHFSSKERTKKEELASSHHVTIQEVNDLDFEIKLASTLETLEDGL